jgi:hypothetical protein
VGFLALKSVMVGKIRLVHRSDVEKAQFDITRKGRGQGRKKPQEAAPDAPTATGAEKVTQ